MRRRVIAGIIAVVLAAAGTAVLVMYVRGAEERALAGQEAVEVLVVTEAIEKGTPAQDIAGRVETRQVTANVRAQGSVDDVAELAGEVAVVDLVPGEQVLAERFADPATLQTTGQVAVPSGMQVVSVELEPQRAVGGQIAPGDTVGFIASFTGASSEGSQDAPANAQAAEGGPTTGFVLHKVLVTNVQGSPVPDSEDETRDGTPDGAQMVSLAVEAGDAERVVFAAENGSIWLTNEPQDAVEEGTQIQRLDRIYP